MQVGISILPGSPNGTIRHDIGRLSDVSLDQQAGRRWTQENWPKQTWESCLACSEMDMCIVIRIDLFTQRSLFTTRAPDSHLCGQASQRRNVVR